MSTPSQFVIDVEKMVKDTELAIDDAIAKITFDILKGTIDKTPVDTGRLKGNWNVSFGVPDYKTYELTAEDPQANKAQYAARVNKEIQKAYTFKAGQVLYFSNGLPYAHRIEFEGWSKVKAPAGMLRISVMEIENNVRKK